MDERKTLYLIGYFDMDGSFNLYSGNSVCNNIDNANVALNDARVNGWNGDRFQIYKILPKDMERIEEDKEIKDFTLLKSKFSNEEMNYYWFNEDLDYKTFVYVELKYNHKNKTVGVSFDYAVYDYHFGGDHDRAENVRKRIKLDLTNRVKYLFIPKIKKILKENDMNIRVEFRNRSTKEKFVRGFIKKED